MPRTLLTRSHCTAPVVCLFALLVAACTPEVPAQSPPEPVPGEIPFRYIDHLFLDVVLNDSLDAVLLYDPVRGVMLDERFARRAGLQTLGGEQVGYGGAVYAAGAGAAEHLVTFVRDLRLQDRAGAGSTIDHTFPLSPVIPLDSMMAFAVGQRVDGLFGIDILADRVLEFDFSRDRLILHDPSGFTPPDGAVGLPITPIGRGDKPSIPVTIHLASGDTLYGQFVLDFGMGGALRLTTGFVEEHRLTERVAPTIASGSETGLGGALQSLIGRVPAVSLGAIRVEAPVISMAQETEGADAYPDHDGLIGLGLLDRYRVFYDAPGSSLWLLPTERSDLPFVYTTTGIGWALVGRDASGLVVRSVRRGSPAAAGGLMAGDRIVSVNSVDASDWTRREWQDAVDAAVLGEGTLDVEIVRPSGAHTRRLVVTPLL